MFSQSELVLRVMAFVDLPEFVRLQMTCRTAVVRDERENRYSRMELDERKASLLVQELVWDPSRTRRVRRAAWICGCLASPEVRGPVEATANQLLLDFEGAAHELLAALGTECHEAVCAALQELVVCHRTAGLYRWQTRPNTTLVSLLRAQAPTLCANYRGPHRADALDVFTALVRSTAEFDDDDFRDDAFDRLSRTEKPITHLVVRRLVDELRFDKTTTLDDDDDDFIPALLRCLQTIANVVQVPCNTRYRTIPFHWPEEPSSFGFQPGAVYEIASSRMLQAIERRIDHDESLCLLLSILLSYAGFVYDDDDYSDDDEPARDDPVAAFYVNTLRSSKIRHVLDSHIADGTPRLLAGAVDSDFILEGEYHFECITTFADLSVEIIAAALFVGSIPTLHQRSGRGTRRCWSPPWDRDVPYEVLRTIESLVPHLIAMLARGHPWEDMSRVDHNLHTIVQLLLAFAYAGLARNELRSAVPLLRDIANTFRSSKHDVLRTAANDAHAVLRKLTELGGSSSRGPRLHGRGISYN